MRQARLLECSFGGQPNRLRLATILERARLEPVNRVLQLPTHTIDEVSNTIDIQGDGLAYYQGTERVTPGGTLSYPTVNIAGNSRFDAVVFNTIVEQYDLVVGTESPSPVTPGFDSNQNLLIAYLLVNEDETTSTQAPPQFSHKQNTDTALDFGGTHQVTAQEIRNLVDNPSTGGGGSGHNRNQDQFLDEGGTYEISAQQAKEAYDARHASNEDTALDFGGPNEISALEAKEAYTRRHDQNSDTKLAEGTADEVSAAELRALADAPPAAGAPEHLRFNFFSDLDTVSAIVTMKGPATVSDLYYGAKLVGVSFQVKLDTSSSYTAQATTTDLNGWISTNVTNPATLWQLYLVADFGSNTGEGSATIVL